MLLGALWAPASTGQQFALDFHVVTTDTDTVLSMIAADVDGDGDTDVLSTGYSRDYHQLTDEPQYINYDLTARVGRFVHDIALTAANRPVRLAVLPDDQQDPAARCGG